MYKPGKSNFDDKVICTIENKPVITSQELNTEVNRILNDPEFVREQDNSGEILKAMVFDMMVNQEIANEWAKRTNLEQQQAYKKELEVLKKALIYEMFEREALGAQSPSTSDIKEFYLASDEIREEFCDEKTGKERDFEKLNSDEKEQVKEMLRDELLQDAIDELKEEFNVKTSF